PGVHHGARRDDADAPRLTTRRDRRGRRIPRLPTSELRHRHHRRSRRRTSSDLTRISQPIDLEEPVMSSESKSVQELNELLERGEISPEAYAEYTAADIAHSSSAGSRPNVVL